MIIFNDSFQESFGTSLSFRFKNFIAVTGKGEEQRIIQWDQPLMNFELSKEILNKQELDILLNFQEDKKGRQNKFLYKDPFDNKAEMFESFYDCYSFGTFLQSGVNRYKLFKAYYQNFDNVKRAISYRVINYPFNLTLYTDNILFTDWTWDNDTKEIVTNTSLLPNVVRKAVFDFYVPVRFGQDEIEYNLIGYDGDESFYSIPKFSLIEVRESSLSNYHTSGDIQANLEHNFALDAFFDSSNIILSNSSIEEVDSGFEQRENTSNRIFKIQLGDRLLSGQDVKYLICLYRVCRGSGSTFQFNEPISNNSFLVRFDDNLSLELNADSNCGVLTNFNSLSLIEVSELNRAALVGDYTITTQEKRKFELYYGFTSANGAVSGESLIKEAYLNGQQFIGGGNIPKTVNGYANLPSINAPVSLVISQRSVGSCFVSSPLDNNFNINNFSLFFSCNVGGDGLAFVLHGQSTGANAIGVMSSSLGNSINFLTTPQILALDSIEGKSLGYVGIAPSIAVELDVYQNEFDIDNNHIGLNLNGALSSFISINPGFPLRDSNPFIIDFEVLDIYVWVDYINPTINIYANNTNTKPSVPLISQTISLSDYLGIYQESVSLPLPSVDKGIYIDTLCYCWKIIRKDGVILGYTNHDRDLFIDGFSFLANGGFSATSLESDYEMTVDNSEAQSFFVENGISEFDILAGKYDQAEVFIYLVNWNHQSIISTFQKGIIGEITTTNRVYTFEIRSFLELLQQKNLKKTSSNCPLLFGEVGANKCNKSLIGLSNTYTLTNVENNRIFSIVDGIAPDHFYDYGTIEFLSGLNISLKGDIYSFDGSIITLWQSMPYPVQIGDNIKLTKGCEKSLTACQQYNNVANFGGDPFVPGADTYLTGALEYSNPID